MKENSRPGEQFQYQKSLKKYGHPVINKFLKLNKYIYRPLAALILRPIYSTKITPNQLTVFSFFCGICAALCFLLGKYIFLAAGAILIQVSYVFDCADGMLARAKEMSSDYGSFLDLTVDRVTDFLLLSGITVGFYHSSPDLRFLIIGLFTVALYFLQISLFYLYNQFFRKDQPGITDEARGVFVLLMTVFALVNRLDIFIYLMFVETIINVLVRLAALIRMRYKKPQ